MITIKLLVQLYSKCIIYTVRESCNIVKFKHTTQPSNTLYMVRIWFIPSIIIIGYYGIIIVIQQLLRWGRRSFNSFCCCFLVRFFFFTGAFFFFFDGACFFFPRVVDDFFLDAGRVGAVVVVAGSFLFACVSYYLCFSYFF